MSRVERGLRCFSEHTSFPSSSLGTLGFTVFLGACRCRAGGDVTARRDEGRAQEPGGSGMEGIKTVEITRRATPPDWAFWQRHLSGSALPGGAWSSSRSTRATTAR